MKRETREDILVGLLIGLLVAAASQWLGAQEPVLNDTARARAIVRRHVAAIGGEQAFKSHRDVHFVMTMSMKGSGGVMRMQSWRSGKLAYARNEVPGLGVVEMGFDGTEGWILTPMVGAQIVPDPTQMTGDLSTSFEEQRMSYLGVRTFRGKDYDAVLVLWPGVGNTTRYFDRKTGLMAGMDTDRTPGPPGAMTMSFDEYKRFGAIVYATRMTTRTADGKELVTRIHSVSHARIDPSRFELPQAVRELVARKP